MKKIDVGGTCIINTDCTQPLVCTMSKCHEECRATVDCPAGEICTRVEGSGVCQLPAEAECPASVSCGPLLICATDLRCRAVCGIPADCMGGQVCVQGVCAEGKELDVTGQLPQKAAPAIPDAGTYDASSPDVPLDLSGDLPLATPDAGMRARSAMMATRRAGMAARRTASKRLVSLVPTTCNWTRRLASPVRVRALNSPSSTAISSPRMSPPVATPTSIGSARNGTDPARPQPSVFPTQAGRPRGAIRPHAAGTFQTRIS